MKEKIADKDWNFTPLANEYFYRGGKTGVLLLHGFTGTPANMHSIWPYPYVSYFFSIISSTSPIYIVCGASV